MKKAEKEALVNKFGDELKGAQAFALMSFSKLKVEDMTNFRLSLRKKDVRVKVVKNTLAKRMVAGTPYEELKSHLTGTTLIAYSKGDAVSTAKAIWEWASKEDFNAKIKVGMALGKIVTEAQLKQLSMLPGRNELLVGFLWALKTHPTNFLYALQDTPKKLAYALLALREKKETSS